MHWSDRVTLGAQRENISTMRFAAECKKRWHMDSQESKQYWDECFSDPTVPKGLSDWGFWFWHCSSLINKTLISFYPFVVCLPKQELMREAIPPSRNSKEPAFAEGDNWATIAQFHRQKTSKWTNHLCRRWKKDPWLHKCFSWNEIIPFWMYLLFLQTKNWFLEMISTLTLASSTLPT